MSNGEAVELTITGLAVGGEGVGRYQGRVVFVPGSAPGDRVRARLTRVARNWARASLLELLQPGPDRRPPDCPLFGRCGGCQIQHLTPEAQLAFKRQVVADALARIGGLGDVPVADCVPPPAWLGYRNKAQFPVALVRDGRERRLAAGIYAPGTHALVEVVDCPIQHPVNNRVLRETVAVARDLGLTAYDEDAGTGTLRHILTRVGVRTGEAMLVLVTREAELPRARALVRELGRRLPELTCIAQNVNSRRTNIILGERTRVLAGKPVISERLGRFRFTLSPGSFFQVNSAQAEAMCRLAAEQAVPTPGGTVLEVYAGIGTISLFLAERAEMVLGVESHLPAVEDARRNAAANRVGNVRFLTGLAERVLPELTRSGLSPGAVVLDPPRKGCAPSVLQAVADSRPMRVVYVSCDPATLARDLAILAGRGYRIQSVVPLDMFPQTAHVEAVATLTGCP
ncbi:MAG TPA: 23S rRNA (uracil(1939)-C(5))-methyltransferase RlmD [Bacillota bacterium]|nr:23S rRNA (uracil(1939)-C(5))-methyltransferase RlmD [Bacillota bacterium]